eukprot:291609_1
MSLSRIVILASIWFSLFPDIGSCWPFSATANPTKTNSSGTYYIASKTNLQSKTITCSSPNCHVICDKSCHQTTISASKSSSLTLECTTPSACFQAQITNGPSDSIAISCLAPTACQNATFNFSTTTNAVVDCRYNFTDPKTPDQGSCFNAQFFGHHTNTTSVDCNALDCVHSVFHVNASNTAEFRIHKASPQSYTKTTFFGSDISGSLTIKCTRSNACRETRVFCPQNAPCNLECDGSFSCAHNIYVPDKEYSYLYLNASVPIAVYDTDIRCLDTAHFSTMKYQTDREDWACDNYITALCCPPIHTLGQTISQCKAGDACTVTCDGDNPCKDTIIRCPGASCTILCDGVESCRDAKIELSDRDALNVSCKGSLSCVGLQIRAQGYTSIDVDSAMLSCQSTSSCANASFIDGITFGSLDIECKENKACEGMQFTEHFTGSTLYSAITIDKALNVYCEASMACHKIHASIMSSATAKNQIICSDPLTSTNTTGACYNSRWYLMGVAKNVGDWNVSCGTFDCQSMVVYSTANLPRYPSNTLRMNCHAPYACISSSINGDDSKALYLDCMSKGSCHKATVRGSSHKSGSSHVTCGKADNACADMQINSPFAYTQLDYAVLDYMVLTCPSGAAYKSSCDGITFNCDMNYNSYNGVPYGHQSTTYLDYDAEKHVYDGCTNGTADADGSMFPSFKDCCPLQMMDNDQYDMTTTGVSIDTTIPTDDDRTTTGMSIGTTIVKDNEDHDGTTTVVVIETSIAMDSAYDRTTGVSKEKGENGSNTHHKSKKVGIVLGVVCGFILGLLLVVAMIWCLCVSAQKKRRNKVGALLSEQINDHSEDRGDVEQQSTPYAPPTHGDTEMTTSQ